VDQCTVGYDRELWDLADGDAKVLGRCTGLVRKVVRCLELTKGGEYGLVCPDNDQVLAFRMLENKGKSKRASFFMLARVYCSEEGALGVGVPLELEFELLR